MCPITCIYRCLQRTLCPPSRSERTARGALGQDKYGIFQGRLRVTYTELQTSHGVVRASHGRYLSGRPVGREKWKFLGPVYFGQVRVKVAAGHRSPWAIRQVIAASKPAWTCVAPQLKGAFRLRYACSPAIALRGNPMTLVVGSRRGHESARDGRGFGRAHHTCMPVVHAVGACSNVRCWT